MKKQFSEQELLEKLKNLYAELGKSPKKRDLEENKNYPSYKTYLDRFGSLNEAKRKARIPVERISKRYSDKELLRELRNFYEKFGRSPKCKDFDDESNNLPNRNLYTKRFGNINEGRRKAGIPIVDRGLKLKNSGILLKEWKEEMKDELERSTLVNYHVALRDLEIFLEEKGKKIEELTSNDIKKYVDVLIDRNYKKTALEKKFTALKSFFRFIERRARLREEKPIIKIPIIEESKIYFKKKLRQIKISESDRLPSLSEEEIQEIRRKLKGEIYLLSLFELDLNLGLRASEFGYIKANIGKFENVNEALEKDIWLDLRKDKGKMLLYRQKRKLYHLVALTDEMIELVKKQLLLRKLYRVNHNFLFFTITGKKVRENSIHESYRKISKITGIKVTSHRLRRTMNTLMELKEIPKMVRRERLGHAPATQTDKYSIMGLDARRIHLETIGLL